jgi:ribosomal protein S18 acetylase RimI-like enzyme
MEKGVLRKNKGTPLENIVSFEMIFLDDSHCQKVAELQDTIVRGLPDQEIFRARPIEDFGYLFDSARSAIGVMTEDGLAAYSLIYTPEKNRSRDGCWENLGRDIDLPEKELESVGHLQAIAVHPAYRGNALQRRMVGHHLNVLREMGVCHALCTVSLKNPVSLGNFLSCGLVIKGLKRKFRGWWRYIMYKNVLSPINPGPGEVWIHGSDIEGQINLIDKGFMGCRMKMLHDGFDVAYCGDSTLVE